MTDAQRKTLEEIKDPHYTLGVARAEFVNQELREDGSLSTGIDALRKRAGLGTRLCHEVEHHLALARYLFIADTDFGGWIYFQTAVKGNPDLPPRIP